MDFYLMLINTFWFFLPAGIANMAPVLFKSVRFLNYPIDFNQSFDGKRLFGKNKTFRGFFFGIVSSIFVVFLQKLLYFRISRYLIFDYSEYNVFFLGFLFGFGALFGDLIESFFKRQIGIEPGKPWIPFDQLDWIIGCIFFIGFYVFLTWQIIACAIILFGFLHPTMSVLGYYLRLKKDRF